MNTNDPNDAKLGALLREGRGAPPLPPRFQQNVWHRVESAEAAVPADAAGWFEAAVALLFRPRLALAALAVVVLAGVLAGALDGRRLAHDESRSRYLAAVAPSTIQ